MQTMQNYLSLCIRTLKFICVLPQILHSDERVYLATFERHEVLPKYPNEMKALFFHEFSVDTHYHFIDFRQAYIIWPNLAFIIWPNS